MLKLRIKIPKTLLPKFSSKVEDYSSFVTKVKSPLFIHNPVTLRNNNLWANPYDLINIIKCIDLDVTEFEKKLLSKEIIVACNNLSAKNSSMVINTALNELIGQLKSDIWYCPKHVHELLNWKHIPILDLSQIKESH